MCQSRKEPELNTFPVRWPREYRRLAEALGRGSPLLAMGEPDPAGEGPDPDALADPTGEQGLMPVPFLVRKHPDRVVVLAASRCFLYCRFCFRRGGEAHRSGPGPEAWNRICAWLERHPEVGEVILSGGDPLTLPDRVLAGIGRRLGRISHVRQWRVHTRAPVVVPRRVGAGLAEALASGPPCRVVIHANHPAEARPALEGAVERLRTAGVPVENQAVLLRGINDSAPVLADLVRRLEGMGVGLRYLHHPDRAPGTGRFWVSLREGLGTVRRAEALLGRSIRYVVDLPTGHGKVPVSGLAPVAEERRGRRRRVRYRWARPAGWPGVAPGRTAEWWDVWEPRKPGPS
ncbi:KamA family radical SAM protein [Deferrisoma camini]|uniref:KamA family radical SAM protein n=1 Tax=Deferrisoma camini TaxID=1035120 RepID=UPI0004BA955D|nr:radical SAM protein [Deferrisoma camini]